MKDLYDDLRDVRIGADQIIRLTRTEARSSGHRRALHADIAPSSAELAEFITSPRTQAALRTGAWLLCQLGLDDSEPSPGEIDRVIEVLGNSSIADAIAATGLADA